MIKNIFLAIVISCNLFGIQEESADTVKFIFEPDSIYLNVGETGILKVKMINKDGELAQSPFLIYGQPRRSLEASPRISDSTGYAEVMVKPHKSGMLKLRVRSVAVKREDRVYGAAIVEVPKPKLKKVVFANPKTSLYQKTSIKMNADVFDEANLIRKDINIIYSTSDEEIAEFDDFGNLKTKKTGKVILTAKVEELESQLNLDVIKNPIKELTINSSKDKIRTGDVLHFIVNAFDRRKNIIADAPIEYSYKGKADYGIGFPASAQITLDGRFVAETAGMYTIYASSNGLIVNKTIKVVNRNVGKELKLIGHGLISDVYTSDLWLWPGIGKHKGKDFAVTGTWGANGEAYFWDVTDPSKMTIIDTITVDARTVNDVKISEDGRVGVITREGASNRKNGFVVLDVTDPYNVKITAEFNDDMTGGVHNVFIYDNHVYAVNNGRKYDIINIEDPYNPFRVGRYELDTPGHGVHDVWVEDGIAYSSNWADGVHAVDVGGVKFNEKNRSKMKYNPFLAMAGQGSPGNPVKLGGMADPNGHNHAAFPFISQSTEKFYIIAGDEWGNQFGMAGGFHFLDFTDPKNPTETAVYQVPEAGSHNHWVHGDTLLASYYQGGLRVVDISGELMGDIYSQGREIAFFLSSDPDGFMANRPNVWGTMPYKGLIYFSDMNNGLWAVKLEDETRLGTN